MTKFAPRTKPFPHQGKAVIEAVRNRNHAVFFEPRLGKSKVGIDYSSVLALKGECQRVLILAPRVALDVWEQQLLDHCTFDAHVENFEEEWSITGRGKPRLDFFLAGREETFVARKVLKGTHTPYRESLHGDADWRYWRPKQEEIEAWDPDVIIVDESHEYSRPGGRAAQDAYHMIERLRKRRARRGEYLDRPYVLLMTGTPNPKGYRNLFAQFRLMNPLIFGTSVQLFDYEFCTFGSGPRKYSVVAYRDTDRLLRKVHANASVCSADEAGLGGTITWQNLYVQLPRKAKEVYDEVAKELIAEHNGELIRASNPGVRRLRLLQIAGGFTTSGECIHREKLAKARDWGRVLSEQGESVLVGARFLPEVRALGEHLQAAGFDALVIQGSTSRRDRAAFIRTFQKGSRPTALVFQIQTGKMSLELTRAAEVLFYGPTDGWVDYWGFLNRVRGPNQHRPVRVTHLIARGTVDPVAMEGLRRKEDWHRTVLKDPRRYLLGL
jgi:hypothetical protein